MMTSPDKRDLLKQDIFACVLFFVPISMFWSYCDVMGGTLNKNQSFNPTKIKIARVVKTIMWEILTGIIQLKELNILNDKFLLCNLFPWRRQETVLVLLSDKLHFVLEPSQQLYFIYYIFRCYKIKADWFYWFLMDWKKAWKWKFFIN